MRINAGIMKDAMAAVDPATKALQYFLAGDIIFAASGIGQNVDKVIGNLSHISGVQRMQKLGLTLPGTSFPRR